MKFSAFMMVSRENALMWEAVASVARQKPDSFIAYIDAAVLPEYGELKTLLEDSGAEVRFIKLTDLDNHRSDLARTTFRGILEAEHPWVLCCDDDDQVLCDVRRDMLPAAAPDVGWVAGDKLAKAPGYEVRFTPGTAVNRKEDITKSQGSAILWNRDAFRRVHRNLDVYHPSCFYGRHYGTFYDYKMMYWLLRAGYRGAYIPVETVLQNVHVDRTFYIPELLGKWPDIVQVLDRFELRLNETA